MERTREMDEPALSEEPRERREDAPPPEPPSRGFIREHPVGVIVGAVVLVAILAGGFWYWQYSQTYESTDDAQIDGHVSNISARVEGVVTAVHVVENQRVQPGELLVELDPRDFQVDISRAAASLEQARAQVRAETPTVPITTTTTQTQIAAGRAEVARAQAAVAGAQRDYEAQRARVAQAEANNARAQADLKRYSMLVERDEVSRQEYDQMVAAAKAAAAAQTGAEAAAQAGRRLIEQQEAALTQAQTQLHQATQTAPEQVSAQRATVELRRAGVEEAQAAVEEARLNLAYTKIAAPIAGLIGRKSVEVGQHVQPGQPLLSVVELRDIWVTANFKETQLRHMRAGQGATLHVDAFDKDYDGYVESLPPATSARFSVLPPENASGNYVKVVQRLPVRLRFKPGQDPDLRLRPGMSVVAKVWLK